jgi:4-amino-4-deoxy-L-arabinose transferase-like glycosyltransferase
MQAASSKWSWRVMRLGLDRNYELLLIGVLLLALLARLAVTVLFANLNPATAELWEYGELARHAITNGTIARTVLYPINTGVTAISAYMPPGYVFVWIAAFELFGNTAAALVAVTALNIASGVAIVWLTARLAQELTGDRLVALLAATLVAVYPTFVFSVVTYHALNLYTAVFLAALLLIMRQVRAPRTDQLIAIGLLGGAAALLRSEFVLMIGALYITLWLLTRRTREFVLLTLISAAVVVPWTVRNYIVFDRVLPIASSVGYNLWKGHNPEARGSGDEIEKIGAAQRQLGGTVTKILPSRDYEITYDNAFRDAALAHIRAHPVDTLILGLKKNLLFWAWEAYDPISWKPAYLAPHLVTTLLGLVGVVIAMRQGLGTAAMFIIAVVVMQSLINAAFSVHVRYRMTIEPLLFIYAGLAAATLLKAWWHREPVRPPATVLELQRPVAPVE